MANNGWSNGDELMPQAKLRTLQRDQNALLASMEKLDTKAPKFKGAIYGGPGTGKTVTALEIAQSLATEEKPGILYIDTAENWASLLNHPELTQNVMRFRYTNWDDLMVLANALHVGKAPFDKFSSIVIDEYNSYVEYDLEWITLQRSIEADNAGAKYRDPYFPQRPDYLAAQHRSNLLLDGLIKVDINVLLVAHEGVDAQTYWTGPDMSAGARKGFMRKLHVVAYAEVNDKIPERYTLRLSPLISRKIHAKGRIGKLGDVATTKQVIQAYKTWGTNNSAPKMEVKEPQPIAKSTNEVDLSNDIPVSI